MSVAPLHVLVVEDDRRLHPLIRRAMSTQHVTLTDTARDALALARTSSPLDVAVVDLGLPDMDGIALLRALGDVRPGTPCLVLTVTHDPARILGALRAGARGYLFKEDLVSRLAAAVEEVHLGGVPLSREVAQLLLAQVAPSPGRPPAPSLTSRELEVLDRFAKSFTYEEAARDLGVSVNTIRHHVRSIYVKLDVCTRTEAVLAALERGLVTPR